MPDQQASPKPARTYRIVILLGCVLLVPVIPFLLFGDILEPEINRRLEDPVWDQHPAWTFIGVVGCLVADILLPIPSSNVCTFAGRIFGGALGTLVSWLGLTVSCGVGYGMGYWFGWPIAKRMSDERSLSEMQQKLDSLGGTSLAIFRGIPVLAEASILVAGIYRLSAWRFWPPVVAANLGLAIAYSLLGHIAGKQGWFGLAMAIAFAIPAVLIASWILIIRKSKNTPHPPL